MADKSHAAIDQAIQQQLATQAAVDPTPTTDAPAPAAPPEQETVLAYGAQGECVRRLAELLAVTGHLSRNINEVSSVDQQLLGDVRAAQEALNITEPEHVTVQEAQQGVKGTLIGQATWQALYAAAEHELGLNS